MALTDEQVATLEDFVARSPAVVVAALRTKYTDEQLLTYITRQEQLPVLMNAVRGEAVALARTATDKADWKTKMKAYIDTL